MNVTYKNIGVIDIKTQNDDVLSSITGFKDVGVLIVRPSNQAKINHANLENVGVLISVSNEAEVMMLNGCQQLSEQFFKRLNSPVVLLMNGSLTIEKADHIDMTYIEAIHMNGTILVQERHQAELMRRTKLNGEIITYRDDEIPFRDTCVVDDLLLKSLPDHAKLNAEALIFKSFDRQLFEQKIESLVVRNHAVIGEEQLELAANKIADFYLRDKTIVPAGFTYYDELTLNEQTVHTVHGSHLYVKKLVVDCDGSDIVAKFSAIQAETIIVDKNNLPTLQSILIGDYQVKFKGCENYSQLLIDQSVLQPMHGSIYKNYGKLIFESDIDEHMLRAAFSQIDNYGKISCHPHQYGYLVSICNNYGKIIPVECSSPDISEQSECDEGRIVRDLGYVSL